MGVRILSIPIVDRFAITSSSTPPQTLVRVQLIVTIKMSTLQDLFSAELLSPEVQAALPEGYKLRALRLSDYETGFLDCLRVLTTVGDISKEKFQERYEWVSNQDGTYFILVIEDTNSSPAKVVGTGALIVERKFIHDLGKVGHIEDIAVAKDQQGKKLGLRIIQALDFIAAKTGCYKTILDCSEHNEGFYVKCGFKRAGLEMAHYHEGPKSK
ncbi:acyl-CoA N-acyltransferase [Cladorrhinum sp. PSN259]|nr:acyl-CoA N-acyltransferase [Cladorrhinum sp. PSN259]